MIKSLKEFAALSLLGVFVIVWTPILLVIFGPALVGWATIKLLDGELP